MTPTNVPCQPKELPEMSLSLASTLAAVGLSASLAVGGMTAVITAGDDGPAPSRTPVQRAENAADRVGDAFDTDRETSVSAKVKTGRASRQAKGGLSADAHKAPASVSASGTADAIVHPGTAGGGVPQLSPGSGHPGGPGGPGNSGSPDLPQITPPSVPSLSQIPSSASAEGSYTVVIPPTGGSSKELCLKGEVDRCKTVTVPPTPGRTMVLRWAGSVGSTLLSFDVEPCPGGIAVTVSGLATGASLLVAVDGHELSRAITSRERSQTASLCDA
jgi:hypothetical protein